MVNYSGYAITANNRNRFEAKATEPGMPKIKESFATLADARELIDAALLYAHIQQKRIFRGGRRMK
jgi:hypothetical protein